jgi:DNA-3-methyladenine glycosylase II
MGRIKDAFQANTPSPSQILNTSDQDLRDLGLSWAKVSYLKDLALAIEEGQLELGKVSLLDNKDLIRELVAIKGIGEWTAQMFLIFCLGRLDILPTGDLGIQKGIQRIAGLDHLPKPVEMTAIAHERGWEPYRSIACWYLWRWLDSPADKATSATS